MSELAPKTRYFFSTAAALYLLDQATKAWIVLNFAYAERLVLIDGILNIRHVRNPGGSFSLLATASYPVRMLVFVGFALVAVAMLVRFYMLLENQARMAALSIGMILAGALGNLTDRMIHGAVIDFIDVYLGFVDYIWPTFNVADSCIVVGVLLMLIDSFLHPPGKSEEAEVETD